MHHDVISLWIYFLFLMVFGRWDIVEITLLFWILGAYGNSNLFRNMVIGFGLFSDTLPCTGRHVCGLLSTRCYLLYIRSILSRL